MNKLRIGVVGLRFGKTWMNGFHRHPACTVACLCDLYSEVLAEASESLGGTSTTTDFDELLADDGIDVVALFTPAPLHGKQAAAALRAGKHVLCAVPAAYTVEDCRNVVAAVQESGRVYMLAENWPYEPSILKAQQLYRDGKLGTIYYGEAEYFHHLESLWQNRDGSTSWRYGREALLYPTHGVGPYLHMTGDRFVEATGYAASPDGLPDGEKYPGNWLEMAVFRSERGTLFKLMNSFCNAHPGGHYYTLNGNLGTFETARGKKARTVATYWLHGETPKEMQREKCQYPPLPDYARNMGAHSGTAVAIIHDFVEAVLKGAVIPIDVMLACDMTLPGICAVESLRTGKTVTIPDPREWESSDQ